MENRLLEVKNLKKYFKTPRGMLHAVDGVSFEINEGKLSMDLADGGVTDVAAFPLVKTRVDGPAMGAYAAILLLIALLTGTVQGIAVTRAKPAAILLGRG